MLLSDGKAGRHARPFLSPATASVGFGQEVTDAHSNEEDAALRKNGWTQEQIDNMSPAVRARELQAIRKRETTASPKQSEIPSPPRDQDVGSLWLNWFKGLKLGWLKSWWWVGLFLSGALFNTWNENRSKNKAQREEAAQTEQNRRAEAKREQEAQQKHERREQQHRSQQKSEQTAHDKKTSGQQWWEVLGVSQDASMDEIKRAYHNKLRMYHPDRVNGLGSEFIRMAEDRTRELNSAFDQAKRNSA